MKDFIKINDKDNVLVALRDLNIRDILKVEGKAVELLQNVKLGHKIAIETIKIGENIIKYGSPIGHATKEIPCGAWIHSHNMKTNLSSVLEYNYEKDFLMQRYEKANLTFKGYKRKNGDVGIRNELWIVPTVGCVNGTGEKIIKRFKEEINPQGIDAIEVLKHNYGCSQLGEDHENTRKILADIVNHPNAGGVLVLGLGCENNYVATFKEAIGIYDEDRVRFLVVQEVGDEIAEGTAALREIYEEMKDDKREELPLSELKIGLKCGGSDGLSGITGNPLVGAFSDFLISQGGTTVLTEVPEMFGAETILMKRAKNQEIFDKTVYLINDFKKYFMSYKQPIYENPSPGNKEGGITTLEEKSLGCTQKGGTAEVVGVLKYGEKIKEKGLNLLNSPGNDLVAATALASSGCQIILFTTGRGTPFGTFVPTIKISTNSKIYNLKPHWIDFNAGVLIENRSFNDVLNEFVQYIIQVASGELVNNEKNEFREISIFKTGVTL